MMASARIRRGKRLALVAAGAATAIVAVAAARVTGQAQQPVFKAAAIHVQVDVIATDKNDKPVTDLTADDFEIRQKGVVQTIADFERVSIPPIDRKIDLTAPLPPPPDAFTNAPPPANARAFVFLIFDPGTDIIPFKRMMASFISALQPSDEVAIVYPGRWDVSQDFTTDTGKLIRAVNNIGKSKIFVPVDWYTQVHSVMRALADSRDRRRVLVLVEGAHPIKYPFPAEYLDTFQTAIRLNIPIYTINPNGLQAPSLGLEGHLEDQVPNGLGRIRGQQEGEAGLKTIAENTNGRAFVNDWNVPQAAATLVGENNSYYLLGFYPSPYEADGKFHDIDVTVKRPGVRIRARQGYTAAASSSAGARPVRPVDHLGAGLPGGDLVLRATATPLSPTPKGANTLVTVDVQYPENASGTDQLDLVWIAIDGQATKHGSGQNAMTVTLSGKSPRVTVHDEIALPKGALTLRVALVSRLTGTHGTVHIPLDVRPFAKAKLEASPLVLSVTPTPPSTVLDINNALGLAPVTPTASRVFSTTDRVSVFARVFTAKGMPSTGEMTLTMPTGGRRPVPLARKDAAGVSGGVDYVGQIDLNGLPLGRYVVTFAASAKSSKTPITRASTFEVRDANR
jgi:VWFA-related protein